MLFARQKGTPEAFPSVEGGCRRQTDEVPRFSDKKKKPENSGL